jgi:hypothetical protein
VRHQSVCHVPAFLLLSLWPCQAGGRVAYNGPIGHRGAAVQAHFEALPWVTTRKPARANPASWVVDIVSSRALSDMGTPIPVVVDLDSGSSAVMSPWSDSGSSTGLVAAQDHAATPVSDSLHGRPFPAAPRTVAMCARLTIVRCLNWADLQQPCTSRAPPVPAVATVEASVDILLARCALHRHSCGGVSSLEPVCWGCIPGHPPHRLRLCSGVCSAQSMSAMGRIIPGCGSVGPALPSRAMITH